MARMRHQRHVKQEKNYCLATYLKPLRCNPKYGYATSPLHGKDTSPTGVPPQYEDAVSGRKSVEEVEVAVDARLAQLLARLYPHRCPAPAAAPTSVDLRQRTSKSGRLSGAGAAGVGAGGARGPQLTAEVQGVGEVCMHDCGQGCGGGVLQDLVFLLG
jgi:hypothetical protein